MAPASKPSNPIRERRKKNGLTIAQFARLLDITPARVIQYEGGHKPPDKRMGSLARALGVEVDELRTEYTSYWDSLYEFAAQQAGLVGSLK